MKKMGLAALALGAAIWCAAPRATAHEGAQGGQNGGNYEQGKGGQQGGQQGETADGLLKAFTEHLQLSQAQQDKIKPILTDMVAQINAAKSDSSLNDQQRGEKAMAARNAAYDKIAAELTPEQKAIFDKHRAGMHNHGGDKKNGQKQAPHKDGGK